MDVPDSEVGYTPAISRREDHEVHKDMGWHWTKKKGYEDSMCIHLQVREKDIEILRYWTRATSFLQTLKQ